jgi:hypothetical protein
MDWPWALVTVHRLPSHNEATTTVPPFHSLLTLGIIIWDAARCSLVEVYGRIRGTSSVNLHQTTRGHSHIPLHFMVQPSSPLQFHISHSLTKNDYNSEYRTWHACNVPSELWACSGCRTPAHESHNQSPTQFYWFGIVNLK